MDMLPLQKGTKEEDIGSTVESEGSMPVGAGEGDRRREISSKGID